MIIFNNEHHTMLLFNYSVPSREKIMTMLHCNDRVTSKICLTGFEKWHVELCRLVEDRKPGTDLLHVQLLLCLNLKELFCIVFLL